MLRRVPFEAAHLDELKPQALDAEMKDEVVKNLALWTRAQDLAYGVLDDEAVVGIGGLYQIHAGRAVAWSYLSACGPSRFLGLHRIVKAFMEAQNIPRIEAWVRHDFTQGHRWMALLDFTLEAARLRRFCPRGHDYSLYARIKEM